MPFLKHSGWRGLTRLSPYSQHWVAEELAAGDAAARGVFHAFQAIRGEWVMPPH